MYFVALQDIIDSDSEVEGAESRKPTEKKAPVSSSKGKRKEEEGAKERDTHVSKPLAKKSKKEPDETKEVRIFGMLLSVSL